MRLSPLVRATTDIETSSVRLSVKHPVVGMPHVSNSVLDVFGRQDPFVNMDTRAHVGRAIVGLDAGDA
jgi:hypothetical protein